MSNRFSIVVMIWLNSVILECVCFCSGSILLNISPVELVNRRIRKLPWTGSVQVMCGQQIKVSNCCSPESYLLHILTIDDILIGELEIL